MKGEHVFHPRHPLTRRQITIRARSARELEAYRHRFESLRTDLRLGIISPGDVDRAMRMLRFGAVTLERAALSYQRRVDISPETRRNVASAIAGPLSPLAGELLEALEAPRLAPLFEQLARTHAKSTIATLWRTLRAVVRHAAERGWIGRVPWGPWRPRRAGKEGRGPRECARTPEELDRLIDAAEQLDVERYRALAPKVAACAYLGLRQGELAGLRFYDVYARRGVVGIRRQWDGQAMKAGGGEIPAPPRLFALLEQHRERSRGLDSGAPVFPRPGGGHYVSGECLSTRDLRAVVRRAGVGDEKLWSPHSLRDTFALLEYRANGGDLAATAKRTRHRSVGALVRYLRSFQRDGEPLALPG